ncbi:hypothetical protein K1T71_013599 [Dendrolimus kikuchii]|uniref:Uncharacterized protein n=1 Tax=Dendrolimus kikuchii TaxID=765133 RepID=A0ACC1CH95_9NEOP|nr:hypothetical protein K1T71_013599 [Dendrolimus kikuchii]
MENRTKKLSEDNFVNQMTEVKWRNRQPGSNRDRSYATAGGSSGTRAQSAHNEPARTGGAKFTSGAIVTERSGRTLTSRQGKLTPAELFNCKVCGGKHNPSICKFKRYVCRVCNREGHLKKMCPRIRSSSSMYNVQDEEMEGTIEEDISSDESDMAPGNNTTPPTRQLPEAGVSVEPDLPDDNIPVSVAIDSGQSLPVSPPQPPKRIRKPVTRFGIEID